MIKIFINIIFCIIETSFITYFLEEFMSSRKIKFSLSITFLIMLMADLFITFFKTHFYIQLIVFVLCCEITLCFFYNGRFLKKTFATILITIVTIIPSLLTIYIISWTANINLIYFIENFDKLRVITNILIKIIQFSFINFILSYIKKDKYSIKMPFLLIYSLVMIISIFAAINLRENLLNGHIVTNLCVYIMIGIMVVDFTLYIILHFMSEISQKNLDIEMKNMTIRQQQKDIENIIHEYYETLKIRHDMDKYINYAIALVEEKEYVKLKDYLSSFHKEHIGDTKTYIKTENKMFNAIINKKLSEAESKGIKVTCNIYDTLYDFDGLEDLELCIIFSNLLDNAIEAEANVETPEIKLTIFRNAGYICFKLENLVLDNILESNPEFKSTKSDNFVHGIGLKSVNELIDKHDGIFNIRPNGNWVSAEVMLLTHKK